MTPPSVLILCGAYLPGFKGGGPIQSVAGLVQGLNGEFRFGVVTSDRDVGDVGPYPGVRPDEWQPRDGIPVLYVANGRLSLRQFRSAVRQFEPDIVYLNSYFSPRFSIVPLLSRWLGMDGSRPLILAPRGEFSPGALAIKARERYAYRWVERALDLTAGVLFQASSSEELVDIREFIGVRTHVAIARNLTPRAPVDRDNLRDKQKHEKLKLIFLSRIVPKKNLDGAIRLLHQVRGCAEFAICGPIEDSDYWRKCQTLQRTLPSNVKVNYLGPVASADVPTLLGNNDFLLLPTHGENYGHVIAESLSAGSPVIISDQTPWCGLEAKGVGWSLPLAAPAAWTAALDTCGAMTSAEYSRMSARARRYAEQKLNPNERLAEHRSLFQTALRLQSGRQAGSAPTRTGFDA